MEYIDLVDKFKKELLEKNYLKYLDEFDGLDENNLILSIDNKYQIVMSKYDITYRNEKAKLYSMLVTEDKVYIKFILLESGHIMLLTESYYDEKYLLLKELFIKNFNYNELKSFKSLSEKIADMM